MVVQSEDQPDRMLLETRICKEDGFQKQQGKTARPLCAEEKADEHL